MWAAAKMTLVTPGVIDLRHLRGDALRVRYKSIPGCGTMRCTAAFRVLVCYCLWRRCSDASGLSYESTPLYLRSAYPLWDPKFTPSHSANEPLLVTPYLRSGHILRAKQLARVADVFRPQRVASYSGYFTVSDQHNSNLFFWFFPAPVTTIALHQLYTLQQQSYLYYENHNNT